MQLRIEPWTEDDLALERRINVPAMKTYLGGQEAEEQVLARHNRLLDLPANGTGQMFRIVVDNSPAGAVGYWDRVWHGETVYEMGWSILPEFQRRGIATAATAAAIARAATAGKHMLIHAFPAVENLASNAVCRKLGFTLTGDCTLEFPPGSFMHCNDWRLNLIESARML
jgi:RimJ/RimL family protein N-acetyltransferase